MNAENHSLRLKAANSIEEYAESLDARTQNVLLKLVSDPHFKSTLHRELGDDDNVCESLAKDGWLANMGSAEDVIYAPTAKGWKLLDVLLKNKAIWTIDANTDLMLTHFSMMLQIPDVEAQRLLDELYAAELVEMFDINDVDLLRLTAKGRLATRRMLPPAYDK